MQRNDSNDILISVVSPVYRAERIVHKLVEEIERSVKQVTEKFEIILVEDGSPDRSWEAIEDLALSNPRVCGLKLSRNFGQHPAITAGIREARGQWVVVMDCDLQDRPDEIPALFSKAQEGFDIILAQRTSRQDSFVKRGFSKVFYKTLSWFTGTDFDPSVANFGIYSKKVISSVSEMNEPIRFFPVMVKWAGFDVAKISVQHAARSDGQTTYSFTKLCSLGLDIVLAYSDKPLRIVVGLGFLISALSAALMAIVVFRALNNGFAVLGYASLVCLILFCTGLMVFILGVVGLYIGKIFEATKGRPIYLISQRLKNHEQQ